MAKKNSAANKPAVAPVASEPVVAPETAPELAEAAVTDVAVGVLAAQEIAMVAHQVNKAYCESQGDDSQADWEDAPEWQKESALKGVELHLSNPDAGPEASHEAWMAHKLEQGWVFGEVKNEEEKTHPALVPFAELPVSEQAKDFLFRAVVHAVNAIKLPQTLVPQSTPEATAIQTVKTLVQGMTPIKYVGKRESYTDGLFGTGLSWNRGETKYVPNAAAALMKKHPDQYEEGILEEVIGSAVIKPKDDGIEEELQEARDLIANMEPDALAEYAKTNFGQTIDQRKNVDTLRSEVTRMVDQFGLK